MNELQEKWEKDIEYFLSKRILVEDTSLYPKKIFDIKIIELSNNKEFILIEYCRSEYREWVRLENTYSSWIILDELPTATYTFGPFVYKPNLPWITKTPDPWVPPYSTNYHWTSTCKPIIRYKTTWIDSEGRVCSSEGFSEYDPNKICIYHIGIDYAKE